MSELPCDPDLFDLMVCPEARVPLKWVSGRLISTDPATRRAYKVVDGYPDLIKDHGDVLDLATWEAAMAAPGPVGGGLEAVRARG